VVSFNNPPAFITLQAHMLAEERRYPGTSGHLSWIVSALAIAAKTIAAKLKNAGIEDVLGDFGSQNVQGERQQKLDVIANHLLIQLLGQREGVAVIGSEENDELLMVEAEAGGGQRFAVLFDPLDGSSNLDTAVGVGTIFTILRNDPNIPDAVKTVCQPGRQQVAAGYVLYGSSTVFVITTGRGVHMFELDSSIGSFMLVQSNIQMPASKKIYSVNEANAEGFPEGFQKYLKWAHQNGYSSRYIGSMVADMHRTLMNGGVFLYPPTKKHPNGKLRLLYEANPMSFLVEQAGGASVTAAGQRTMDIVPSQMHERVPLVLGSKNEVAAVVSHL
jgi:fructose-1,6-bisphosphatase I